MNLNVEIFEVCITLNWKLKIKENFLFGSFIQSKCIFEYLGTRKLRMITLLSTIENNDKVNETFIAVFTQPYFGNMGCDENKGGVKIHTIHFESIFHPRHLLALTTKQVTQTSRKY